MLAIGLIFAAAGAVMIVFCCRMCDVPDQDYNTLHSDQPKRLVSSGDVRLQFHNETSSSGCRSSTGSQMVNYPALTEDEGVGVSEQSKGGYLDSSGQCPEPPRQYLDSSGQYQESLKKQLNGIKITSEEETLNYQERNGRMASGNSASLDNTNPSYPLPPGGSSPSYSVPLGGLPTNYSIQVAGTPPTYSMLPGGLPMSYCYSLPPGGPTTCYSLPPGGPILNYSSSPGEANFPMSPNGAISGFPIPLGRSIPDYLRPSGDSIDSYIPSAPNQISSDIPPPYTVTPFK
nr:uncharacterized protein LOC128696006 isoform X1 [Cherax quadricarinatus]